MNKRCDQCSVLKSCGADHDDCSCGGTLYGGGENVYVTLDGNTEEATFVKWSGTGHRIVTFSTHSVTIPLHPNDKMVKR